MIKDYILDTNVLLHDCQSILMFEDNNVIIPMTVLEELDHFKKEMNELGRNARHLSKMLDTLREGGSLVEGVKINDKGGTLRVAFCREEALIMLPRDMDQKIADNRILATAMFNHKYSKHETILVTQDTNLRIKADALALKAQPYENGKIDFESLYTGYSKNYTIGSEISPNEYVSIFNSKGLVESVGRYDLALKDLVPLREDLEAWGLTPKNEEQRYAMDLLLNDDIKLVTLVGKAGSGKTLLSIAAGLRKVTDEFVYRKMLVSRPVYPMGKDIGFLPGDINEKLAPYIQPIFDNLEFLISGYSPAPIAKRKKKSRIEEEKDEGMLGKGYMELMAAGIIEVEPLLYIRGRSIPNQYMVIDEVQNLSPHEVKTIVTRAGVGTKLVFTGDPYQIDNPYLDASSNGLTYLVERFRGEAIAGHVTLVQGERSELAEIATNIL
jgi:PhoH-like ATPase